MNENYKLSEAEIMFTLEEMKQFPDCGIPICQDIEVAQTILSRTKSDYEAVKILLDYPALLDKLHELVQHDTSNAHLCLLGLEVISKIRHLENVIGNILSIRSLVDLMYHEATSDEAGN